MFAVSKAQGRLTFIEIMKIAFEKTGYFLDISQIHGLRLSLALSLCLTIKEDHLSASGTVSAILEPAAAE